MTKHHVAAIALFGTCTSMVAPCLAAEPTLVRRTPATGATLVERIATQIATRVLPGVLAKGPGNYVVTHPDGHQQKVGSQEPAFHATVTDPGYLLRHLAKKPRLLMADALVDGAITLDGDHKGPDAFFYSQNLERGLALAAAEGHRYKSKAIRLDSWFKRLGVVSDMNSVRNAKRAIQHHYDVGNDFYALWLDSTTRAYSCAYPNGKPGATLAEAQVAKLRLIYNKLRLVPGQRLLDIGSGWGELAIRAAKERGVKAVGLTLSQEQYDFAVAKAKAEGVDHLVEFHLMDFREYAAKHPGEFDAVVSVGMYEHLGSKPHYDAYMRAVSDLLKEGGRSVLHTITSERQTKVSAFISEYIFPGGNIPAKNGVGNLLSEHGFTMKHHEDLDTAYAWTLDQWSDSFRKALPQIRSMVDSEGRRRYDERFLRVWWTYLRGSAQTFRHGDLSLSQWVFTKGKNPDELQSNEDFYRDLYPASSADGS